MTVLVSDSFNRTASTTTLGTTDSYNGGTAKTWTIGGLGGVNYGVDASGRAYCATAGSNVNHSLAYVDVGQSDFTLEVMVAVNTGENPKIAFRTQDVSNTLLLQAGSSGGLILYGWTGGSDLAQIASETGTSVVNGDTVKIVCQGTTITAYINNIQRLQATNVTTFQTATSCGITAYKYPNSRFDNFIVSDVSVPPINISSTVKSNSSTSNTIKDTRSLVSTVKSNSNQSSTIADMTSGTLSSTVKSNSSASNTITDTRLLGSSVKSNSSANGIITNKLPLNLPTVNKTVVVIMENHAQNELDGNSSAPYFNSLLSQGANFKNMKAIEHPSQPNYLDIFSGVNQGCTDDNYITSYSINQPNLYTVLNAKGKTFATYSEDMPSVGYTGDTFNNYASKHNPASKFSNVPTSTNKPFAGYFPKTTGASTDFNTLPDVSFVIPNLINDIHDGTISQGDTWLQTYIDPYVQWAKTNNSLLIVMFDEDDSTESNIIPFVMVGSMVKKGVNNTAYNHYSTLRTMIDLYGGTSYPANSTSATTIIDAWLTPVSSSVKSNSTSTNTIKDNISLNGLVKSNSSSTVTVKVTSQTSLSSTIKSNSTSIASLNDNRLLNSNVKSNTSISSTIKDTRSLSATNKSNTNSTANITLMAQGGMVSSVRSNSSSIANLTVSKRLSATNKSLSSATGVITDNRPLSSTSKSNSNTNATIRSFQLITSNAKSNTTSTSILSNEFGVIHISSNVKSNSSTNNTLKNVIFLVNVSKSHSHATGIISYIGIPDYEQIIKYNLYIQRMLQFNSNIKDLNNASLKI